MLTGWLPRVVDQTVHDSSGFWWHRGSEHHERLDGPPGARSAWDLMGEPDSRAKPEKERRRGQGRGSVRPSPENFWNFELQIFKSDVWWKGKYCPKMGSTKIRGSWPLDPSLVAPLLEQAVDASFYELTFLKQLNDLGVGSVELQSSLFSSHIWSDEIVICMRRIIILLFYILMFFIIIQYYDNAFQKLYFLMQFLPICYRIHRSMTETAVMLALSGVWMRLAVRWKAPCRKGYGWYAKLTWLALLSLYYIL